MVNRLIAIFCAALMAFGVRGEQSADSTDVIRPVLSSFMLEYGGVSTRDTYLTPLEYKGWTSAIAYERMQAMCFNPERWVMRLDGRLAFGRSLNPARTAVMWEIGFRPSWSMMWRARLPHGFTLAAGGNVGAHLGVIYLPRNGNNPASVKASITLAATGMAVWNGRIGRLPLTVRYQPTLPLVGAFFSPDYDELYYEIWLGNHNGLAHCAWPGDFFRLDNLLTADLHFGATTLRLGYRCEVFSGKSGDIVNRQITHCLVLGVSTELISLRAGASRTPDARIISSLY